MKGKHQGVQNRFLEINLKALYMSCVCYSLKLTLFGMTHTCVKVVSFFGFVQHIYSLFANSTKRLKVSPDNVLGLNCEIFV